MSSVWLFVSVKGFGGRLRQILSYLWGGLTVASAITPYTAEYNGRTGQT